MFNKAVQSKVLYAALPGLSQGPGTQPCPRGHAGDPDARVEPQRVAQLCPSQECRRPLNGGEPLGAAAGWESLFHLRYTESWRLSQGNMVTFDWQKIYLEC